MRSRCYTHHSSNRRPDIFGHVNGGPKLAGPDNDGEEVPWPSGSEARFLCPAPLSHWLVLKEAYFWDRDGTRDRIRLANQSFFKRPVPNNGHESDLRPSTYSAGWLSYLQGVWVKAVSGSMDKRLVA